MKHHLNPWTRQYQQTTPAFTTFNYVTHRVKQIDENNSLKSYDSVKLLALCAAVPNVLHALRVVVPHVLRALLTVLSHVFHALPAPEPPVPPDLRVIAANVLFTLWYLVLYVPCALRLFVPIMCLVLYVFFPLFAISPFLFLYFRASSDFIYFLFISYYLILSRKLF